MLLGRNAFFKRGNTGKSGTSKIFFSKILARRLPNVKIILKVYINFT